MRLLLHLAAKDVGHLRAEVVLFSAVVALDSLLFATDAGQAARGAWDPAAIAGAIALFLTLLLAAQLAQVDSMSRATAFWRTRPIARSAMAAEKLALGVALLAGWPAVTDSVAALSLGLPFGEVFGSAGDTILNQLFLVLPAMAIAAFTRDLLRFMVALVGAVVWWWVSVATIDRLITTVTVEDWSGRTPGVVMSAMLGSLLVASGLAAVLFWLRYVARLRKGPLIGALLAPVIASVVVFSWPWDLLRQKPVPQGLAGLDLSRLSLSAVTPLVVDPGSHLRVLRTSGEQKRPILWFTPLAVDGLPEWLFVQPTRVASRAVLAGGITIETDRPGSVRSVRLPNLLATPLGERPAAEGEGATISASAASRLPSLESAMSAGLDGARWLRGPSSGGDYQMVPAILAVPRHVDRPGEATPVTIDATVTFDAWRFTETMGVPPRPDARASAPGATIDVIEARQRRSERDPDLVVLLHDRGLRYRVPLPRFSTVRTRYALVNRAQRQAIVADVAEPPGHLRHLVWWLPSLVNGVTVLSFTTDRATGTGPRPNQAWLDEAKIVRIDPVYLGSFTRPLHQVVELPLRLLPEASTTRRRVP